MYEFREKELKAIYRFIAEADDEELADIVNEINVCHGIYIMLHDSGKIYDMDTVCLGRSKITLTTKECEEWK